MTPLPKAAELRIAKGEKIFRLLVIRGTWIFIY